MGIDQILEAINTLNAVCANPQVSGKAIQEASKQIEDLIRLIPFYLK